MITNVKMSPVPSELIAEFDPSALTVRKSHTTKKSALLKVDAARLKALKLKDFDRFIMLLLAAVGMMSNTQMKALLTCVPSPSSPIGFEGMMSNLQTRFGIALNIRKAIGRIHNPDAAYLALRRLAKKGLVRTVLQGQNVAVRTELAGRGVEVGWMLTPLGAAVLLELTIRKKTEHPLTVEDIKFCVHESRVGLDTQTHNLGVASFLTGLCVGAAYYNNREVKPIQVDVTQVIGDGKDFEIDDVKVFRPDLSVVAFIKSVNISLFLEWETDKSTATTAEKKCKAYMRLVINAPAGSWSAGRPWLVFVIPSAGRAKGYQTAIHKAAEFVGLMNAQTYDAMDFARVAVCTYEDLGQSSPYGAIYRIFDYDTGKLSDEKFTLVSLHANAKNERSSTRECVPPAVPVRPSREELIVGMYNTVDEEGRRPSYAAIAKEVGVRPERISQIIKKHQGASAPLIGHIEESCASSPLIGYATAGGGTRR